MNLFDFIYRHDKKFLRISLVASSIVLLIIIILFKQVDDNQIYFYYLFPQERTDLFDTTDSDAILKNIENKIEQKYFSSIYQAFVDDQKNLILVLTNSEKQNSIRIAKGIGNKQIVDFLELESNTRISFYKQ